MSPFLKSDEMQPTMKFSKCLTEEHRLRFSDKKTNDSKPQLDIDLSGLQSDNKNSCL